MAANYKRKSEMPELLFRYFDIRGRGQFIRGLLQHRGLPFQDERIVLSADNANWPDIRSDRKTSGYFQKMPTLQCGDILLNEVLVILNFLQDKLGDSDLLDSNTTRQHAMLGSSAFLDLLTPCINLIWCDVFHPGTDVAAATAILKRRLAMHLASVNQTLDEWQWLDHMPARPVMAADAVLWEALDVIRLTFDDHVSFEELECLATFYDDCPGAPTFRKLLSARHLNITGRPGEPAALQLIHESLASS